MPDYYTAPRSLKTGNEAFMDAGFALQGLLRAMYDGCDRYGLLPGTERALRGRTGVMDGTAVLGMARSLEERALVAFYEVDGRDYIALLGDPSPKSSHLRMGYDEHLTKSMRQNRGKPDYPLPPWWVDIDECAEWPPAPGGAEEGPDQPTTTVTSKSRPTYDHGHDQPTTTVTSKSRPTYDHGHDQPTTMVTTNPEAPARAKAMSLKPGAKSPSQSDPGGRRAPSRAGAREAPPPRPPPAELSPEAKAAAKAWLHEVFERQSVAEGSERRDVLRSTYEPSLQRLAATYPDSFVSGVHRMLASGKGWVGNPVSWLERDCQFEAEKPPSQRAGPPPAAPPPAAPADPVCTELAAIDGHLEVAVTGDGDERAGYVERLRPRLEALPTTNGHASAVASRLELLDLLSRPRPDPEHAAWLAAVREQREPYDVVNWLMPLRPVAVGDDGRLVLLAPDAAHRDFVRSQGLVDGDCVSVISTEGL